MSVNPNPQTPNEYADIYRIVLGWNVIPSYEKIPRIHWKPFQDKGTPDVLHKNWKRLDCFRTGIQAIAGRVWHNPDRTHLFSWAIDIDNEIGTREILNGFGVESLEELSQKYNVLVSQRGNTKDRCHIYGYSNSEIKKKILKFVNGSADRAGKKPIIEIHDSTTVITLPPTTYNDGSNLAFIGRQPYELKPEPFDRIESIVVEIYQRYDLLADHPHNNDNDIDSINGNSEEIIKELIKLNKIVEENNRNNTLFQLARKIRAKNYSELSEDRLKELLYEWNQICCRPPLPDKEFDKTWESSKKYVKGELRQENQKQEFDELIGNMFYKMGDNPAKYIVAHEQTKQLNEYRVTRDKQPDKQGIVHRHLYHQKTYLACIPTKIIRHKNPLAFLDLTDKYSISFDDYTGYKFTLAHKSLAEIVTELKERSYVLGDGVDMALSAMVQAYKQDNEIIDNEEMDYVGFFIDKDHKIIASNIDIKETVISKLNDALLFIEELKLYFDNRLELLSSSITWGMVAPVVFMLKTNNYFLKWLHFYGFPNATKSNTGKIILGIDGHHNDTDYLLNFSRIDTVARLGDAVSHTTFPKLVDEVDLNNPAYGQLINAVKSCIESTIARGKFLNSKAGSTTPIPALSPLILTSNPPPPFHEAGYMRRIIERNFPQSESWKENDPKALEFKEFLRLNLDRLKALGNFRNWFVMNNQDTILDEKRLPPLDLGLKILEASYEAAGREMPSWLKLRLPENQLEESFEDNSVIVKRAFEKYIDEQINKALSQWRLEKEKEYETQELREKLTISIPTPISDKLIKLAFSNLLPDIKITKNFETYGVVIRRGILTELYSHGVTHAQLSNLKALADYMNADYKKSNGNKVVAATWAQLDAYFDKEEKIE